LKKIQHLKRLTNVKEICEAINNYHQKSNNRKIENDILPINHLAVILPINQARPKIGNLKIPQIRSLYNIQNVRIKKMGELNIIDVHKLCYIIFINI